MYKHSGKQIYEHHMKYCPSTAPQVSFSTRILGRRAPPLFHLFSYFLTASRLVLPQDPSTDPKMPQGAGWDKPTTTNVYDNATQLHAAWGLVLDAAAGCNASSPAFVFDLVDVGPSSPNPFRASVCAAPTLNAAGQSRVTLSLR